MSVKTGKTVGVLDFIRSEQSPMGLFRIAPGIFIYRSYHGNAWTQSSSGTLSRSKTLRQGQ